MNAPTTILLAAIRPESRSGAESSARLLRLAIPPRSARNGAIAPSRKPARYIPICLAATAVIGVLDLVLTLAVCRAVGPSFEANPLARYLLEIGPLPLAAFKSLTTGGNIAITWALRHRRCAATCACLSAVIMLLLGAHWAGALYTLHQAGTLDAVLW